MKRKSMSVKEAMLLVAIFGALLVIGCSVSLVMNLTGGGRFEKIGVFTFTAADARADTEFADPHDMNKHAYTLYYLVYRTDDPAYSFEERTDQQTYEAFRSGQYSSTKERSVWLQTREGFFRYADPAAEEQDVFAAEKQKRTVNAIASGGFILIGVIMVLVPALVRRKMRTETE